jgi:hypothetical protein
LPQPVSDDELGRHGAEHGGGERCVGAALASHDRGHRFETCHALIFTACAGSVAVAETPLRQPSILRQHQPSPMVHLRLEAAGNRSGLEGNEDWTAWAGL